MRYSFLFFFAFLSLASAVKRSIAPKGMGGAAGKIGKENSLTEQKRRRQLVNTEALRRDVEASRRAQRRRVKGTN